MSTTYSAPERLALSCSRADGASGRRGGIRRQSQCCNAIALAHSKRVDAIADVPTFAEAGMPGFTAGTWHGLLGPASVPAELQNRIHQDVSKIVANPEFARKLTEMGTAVYNSSPQEFRAFVQSESQRWAEAVRLSNAQGD